MLATGGERVPFPGSAIYKDGLYTDVDNDVTFFGGNLQRCIIFIDRRCREVLPVQLNEAHEGESPRAPFPMLVHIVAIADERVDVAFILRRCVLCIVPWAVPAARSALAQRCATKSHELHESHSGECAPDS